MDVVDDSTCLDELCQQPPALVIIPQREDRDDVAMKHGERHKHVATGSTERLLCQVAIGIDSVEDGEPSASHIEAVSKLSRGVHVPIMYSFGH